MRPIDWALIREETGMVLLTAKHVGNGAQLMAADFKDTHVLVHRASRSFIGMDETGVIRLARQDSIRMVDGVWRAALSTAANEKYSNVLLAPDSVSLEIIG